MQVAQIKTNFHCSCVPSGFIERLDLGVDEWASDDRLLEFHTYTAHVSNEYRPHDNIERDQRVSSQISERYSVSNVCLVIAPWSCTPGSMHFTVRKSVQITSECQVNNLPPPEFPDFFPILTGQDKNILNSLQPPLARSLPPSPSHNKTNPFAI